MKKREKVFNGKIEEKNKIRGNVEKNGKIRKKITKKIRKGRQNNKGNGIKIKK